MIIIIIIIIKIVIMITGKAGLRVSCAVTVKSCNY